MATTVNGQGQPQGILGYGTAQAPPLPAQVQPQMVQTGYDPSFIPPPPQAQQPQVQVQGGGPGSVPQSYGLPYGQQFVATYQPYAPQASPQQFTQQMYGQSQAAPQQPQPATPQPGYGPPQQPQQPQQVPVPGVYNPQQPQPQPQAPAQPPQQQFSGGYQLPQGVTMETRLQGAGVPAALQGRTVAEALALRQQILAQGGGTQAQAPAPQPQAQAPAQRPSFYTNPEESFSQLLDEKLGERLAPLESYMSQQAVTSTFEKVQGMIPDLPQLQTELASILQGATPQHLADPQVWMNAADLARGRLARAGRYQPQVPQVPQPQAQPYYGPGAAVPAAPPHMFFTEGPSAPAPMANVALKPEQQAMARLFNMDDASYAAWAFGAAPQPAYNGGFR